MSAFSFGVAEYSRGLAGRELPVTFLSAGEQLVGMLHLPARLEREDCPGVVLLHGYTGTKVEPHRIFVKTARRLAETGMVVLRFDFWGSGDSAGDFSEMTISRELDDARVALDALERLEGVDPNRLGVLGLSLGGGIASTLAGMDGRVRSLVLWAPVSSDPPELIRNWAGLWENRPDPTAPCVEMGGFVLKEAFFRDLAAWGERHLPIAMNYTGPVLIVHGSADEVVPVVYGQRYAEHYARRPGHPRVELEIVPEADHTFNRTDWERQTIERSVAFFADTLR